MHSNLKWTLVLSVLAVLVGSPDESRVVSAADRKPLKVFILAGQSNMQGHAQVRTFDAMRLNPRTAPPSIAKAPTNKK